MKAGPIKADILGGFIVSYLFNGLSMYFLKLIYLF